MAVAKQALMKLLGSPRYPCDTDTTIEAWLKQLVGRYTCKIVNTPNPPDVKSWHYCAQATTTPSPQRATMRH